MKSGEMPFLIYKPRQVVLGFPLGYYYLPGGDPDAGCFSLRAGSAFRLAPAMRFRMSRRVVLAGLQYPAQPHADWKPNWWPGGRSSSMIS